MLSASCGTKGCLVAQIKRGKKTHAKTCNTAGSEHQRERERKENASKTDPLFMVTIHFNGEFVGSCCQTIRDRRSFEKH